MKKSAPNTYPFTGLTDDEVIKIRSGLKVSSSHRGWLANNTRLLLDMIKEPMFLLLLACASIYFVLGEMEEAWFMVGAIVMVAAISLYQEIRQKKALDALKDYTKEKQKVIRNNVIVEVDNGELVPGDHVVCSEGDLIPADGMLLANNDFSANESLLTGESLPVYKYFDQPEFSTVFQGSMVTSGQCVFSITLVGDQTRLGQMGKKMDSMKFKKSPLQIEIGSFVTKMAIIGTLFFVCICIVSYLKSGNFIESLLAGLTIAMSVLPEEIPVAYTTFMALGAWRLIQKGILVKKTDIVEALGNTRFLCLDKTGTITQNKMELVTVYDFTKDIFVDENNFHQGLEVIETAMWASESQPFDQMEKSLHFHYKKGTKKDDRPHFKMIFEYPLQGSPPTMTHVFQNEKKHTIIAMKGAPEAVLKYSEVSDSDIYKIEKKITFLASQGYRILGVGKVENAPDKLPKKQEEFRFSFVGLVAFYDPPKPKIEQFFQNIHQAGIQTKIITGDNLMTTLNIAEKAGLGNQLKAISEKELSQMDAETFEKTVLSFDVFARISPEIKLQIINTLEKHGIVAMTGDGVNDGLALKAANVGISMGKNGTEIARLASSIILTDDKIEKVVDAVLMGRKIYSNLQKAIRYIISIHVPIILIVSLPMFLGWPYASIFSPVHIIFLELLMGPTCSIVFENEPAEPGIMKKRPVQRYEGFISLKKINLSILQGLVITLFGLAIYKWGLINDWDSATIRTMIFVNLITANIALTLTNRSFYHSMWYMLKVKNNLLIYILSLTIAITFCILYIPNISSFFKLTTISYQNLGIAIALGFGSVLWFEIFKWYKRMTDKEQLPVSL